MAELNYRDGFPDMETKVEGTRAKQVYDNSNFVFDDEDAVFVSRQDAIDFEQDAEFVSYSLPERGAKNVSAGGKIFAELSSFASFFGKNVVPAASGVLGQSAEYIKAAFSTNASSKTDATSEESTASAKTYGQIALRFAEAAIVKVVLPTAALCADVPVIGGTLVASTGLACVVNLAGLVVKSGATQVVPNNAKQIQESVNSGLDCFNKDLFKITVDLCSLEHKMLYGGQWLVGQGISTLANNIEDPSAIMEAGKTAMNFAFSAWDSVKCGCEYAYSFMASEKAECSGESESLEAQSV
jgi:hypothetical protein